MEKVITGSHVVNDYGYKAFDGTIFNSSHECIEYESSMPQCRKEMKIHYVRVLDEPYKIAIAYIKDKSDFVSFLLTVKNKYNCWTNMSDYANMNYQDSFADNFVYLAYDCSDDEWITCGLLSDKLKELETDLSELDTSIKSIEAIINNEQNRI